MRLRLSDPERVTLAEIGKRLGRKALRGCHGQDGGSIDVDDEFAARWMANFGAFILGRNMFGPVRGAWPDNSWKDGGETTRRITFQS